MLKPILRFLNLPDQSKRHGVRYALAVILVALVLAKLAVSPLVLSEGRYNSRRSFFAPFPSLTSPVQCCSLFLLWMDDRELEPMRTFDSLWCPAPTSLTLSSDEVHIWRASLGLTSSQVQKLEQTLTIDEIGRAARYYFPNDRRRFIISRGLLRSILSFYLNTEPDQLRFRYGTNGKPLLAAATGRDILSFNLSHSGELVLYAVTRSRRVGIDLERVRPDIEYEQIAVRFFSPHEIAVLQGLPTHVRPEAFFTCWTCKEAYIKAKGESLSLPLNWFEVSVAPDEPVMIFHIRGDPQEASQWSLQQLNPGPGYVACLVVEGHNYRLKCWQYPEL